MGYYIGPPLHRKSKHRGDSPSQVLGGRPLQQVLQCAYQVMIVISGSILAGKPIGRSVRGRGVKGQQSRSSLGNPFLLSAESAHPVASQKPSASRAPSNNPFFAAISKQVASAPPPPPSYASVVSGQGAGSDTIFPPPGPPMGTVEPTTDPFNAKPSNLISAPTLPTQRPIATKSALPLHTQSKQPRVAHGIQPKSSSFPSGFSTTLHLKLLPQKVNTPEILHKHFSKFGRVEDIRCTAEKMTANVTFKTHVSSLCFFYR